MMNNKVKVNSKSSHSNYYSSNLDVHIIEKLSAIVGSTNEDYNELIKFVSSGNLTRITNNWSQLSSTNNHSQFIDLSVKLSKVTHQINFVSGLYNSGESTKNAEVQLKLLELKPMILEFYNDLLKNHLKVIYRALNSGKPSLTNPILRFLCNLLEYHPSLANEFLNSVDLNSNLFPKLLIPTKQELEQGPSVSSKDHLSIRFNFIKFWLKLNTIVPNYTRKDLLINYYKIMNNLWKYMYEFDSISTLRHILGFIDSKILNESGFKRSTKCKILNDNFMFKISYIFNRLGDDEEFNKIYINFMNKISTDSKEGLTYVNDKLWQDCQVNGVSVQMNNKTFKINNKLVFTLLTTLKPWESNSQMQLTLNILKVNAELVAPYMNWTVQNGGGYHDPNLSSWWIGHTLLFSHILQLPIPNHIIEIDGKNSHEEITLSNKLVMESITLAPLSKSSIIKCIESKNTLIKQLTFQLVYFILQKLENILKLDFIQKKQELIDLVFNNLPDLSIFIQAFNAIRKENTNIENMKLTKLTIIMIMNSYTSLYPNNAALAALSKISNSEINEIIGNDISKCSGFGLVLLDNFLSIQSHGIAQQDLKWWNKAKDGNSFFTSLLKLSINNGVDKALTWKIHNLLIKLIEGHLLFDKELIVSPLLALIYSLKDEDNITASVWNLLDEVISRSIRTPYKYLDLAHEKYDDISLFVVVLIEQFAYLITREEVDIDNITRILFSILRRFISIGESKEAIFKLLEDKLFINSNFKEICTSNKYIDSLEFTTTIDGKDETIMDLMLNKSNSYLAQNLPSLSLKIPTSNLEFASILWRLKLVVKDSSSDKLDNLILELVSKIGNYLLSVLPDDFHIVKFVLSRRFWESLIANENQLIQELDRKSILVGGLISEVLQQLPKEIFGENFKKHNQFNSKVYDFFANDSYIPQDNQIYISKFSWVLTDEQCLELLENAKPHNEYLVMSLFQTVAQRELVIAPSSLLILLKKDFSKDSMKDLKKLLLIHFLEKSLVNYVEIDLINHVNQVLDNSLNHYLLKSFIVFASGKKFNLVNYLIERSESIKDEYFLCYIGYAISTEPLEDTLNEKVTNFIKKVTDISLEILQNGLIESKLNWNQLLTLLKHAANDKITETNMTELINGLFKEVDKRGFRQSTTPEFAALIFHLLKYTTNPEPKIKSWIQKAMLYITKKYTESAELSVNFENFIREMKRIVELVRTMSTSIWKIVPISIINTQLEALLNHKTWIKRSLYLEFVNSIIVTGSKNIIKFDRLLQIFINNEHNALNELPTIENSRVRFESALIIHNLFYIDPKANSTSTFLDRVILLYLGSVRSEDLLLKSVLISCEENLTQNWMNKITNWEFVEELKETDIDIVGEERLILKDKSSFTVSINKNFVKNSISTVASSALAVPSSVRNIFDKNANVNEIQEELRKFYLNNELHVDRSYQKTVYDSEFIMMLIIHNDEIVKFPKEETEESNLKFDLKNLIDSYLLQLIVFNISKSKENKISIILLNSILKSLDDHEFKDKSIFKIYISNILYTIGKEKQDNPALIWLIYSNLVPILANPGHFLYEKTFRYVLSHPIIKGNEIPMYSEIILSKNDKLEFDNNDSYYKQVTWLLENFVQGTRTLDDLNVIKFKGVVEWMLNLLSSPYLLGKIRTLILSFLYILQNIDQGSDLLISRFAVLTSLEQYFDKIQHESNEKKTELLKDFLKINIEKISLRFGITASSSKRIRDWTSDDLPNYVKRMHT